MDGAPRLSFEKVPANLPLRMSFLAESLYIQANL